MTREAQQKVEKFLQNGEKVRAIKYIKDTYGFSLEQSRILVEAIEGHATTETASRNAGTDTLSASATARVSELLRAGKKIEAIRYVKDSLNVRLKQAKTLVEEVERSVHPVRPGSATPAARLVLLLFGIVGLVFVSIAGYLFYSQNRSIQTSDLVPGRVIRLVTQSDGMSAPVIEYRWNGQKWLHASKTYSSPPAYDLDEEVPVYVNRADPSDIIVNTFLDRWFLVTIFGSMGLLFTGIPIVLSLLGRHRVSIRQGI